MPVVVRRVVDQNGDPAKRLDRGSARLAQRSNVDQVDFIKQRRMGDAGISAASDRGMGVLDALVDERDLASLASKLFDDRSTDAVSATGDEYRPIEAPLWDAM